MPKGLLCLYSDSILFIFNSYLNDLYYRIENAVCESFQCDAYLIFLSTLSLCHIFIFSKKKIKMNILKIKCILKITTKCQGFRIKYS